MNIVVKRSPSNMVPFLFVQQIAMGKNKPEYFRLQNNNMWNTPRKRSWAFVFSHLH